MNTTGNQNARGDTYSGADMEKIRGKAHSIWEKKCQSFNTAFNDWLEAECEIREKLSIEHKKSGEYTDNEITKIKERAQIIHEEKIKLLNTALDDWLEAENSVEQELKNPTNVRSLFDVWFRKLFTVPSLSSGKATTSSSEDVYKNMDQHYVEMMSHLMS